MSATSPNLASVTLTSLSNVFTAPVVVVAVINAAIVSIRMYIKLLESIGQTGRNFVAYFLSPLATSFLTFAEEDRF